MLSLGEIEKPVPKAHEVLIRVHTATVNRTDCANLTAKPFIMRFALDLFKPGNQILGTDFAGSVVDVGKAVSEFKVGDRVFGFNDGGFASYVEYTAFPADSAIAGIPETVGFEKAAASLEGAHYAYNFINKVADLENKSVLIHGGTGAIGSAGIQLCRYFGAEVTATRGTGHEELVKKLGAVRVINWQETDFTKDSGKFDFVFDMVGKSTYGKCKKLLKPDGVYISSELGPNVENIPLSLFNRHVKFPLPLNRRKSVTLIASLLANGEFDPVIDRIYLTEEVAEAFRYVLSGKKLGNVILRIAQNNRLSQGGSDEP